MEKSSLCNFQKLAPVSIDVQWQIWQLDPSWFPRLMLRGERYREQVKGREARPQVLKEGSGVKEDAAAKETLEMSDLRAVWRAKHRVVGEDRSTTFPYSHPSNFDLRQGNHNYSSCQVPSMHVPTTPEGFYA